MPIIVEDVATLMPIIAFKLAILLSVTVCI